MSVNGALTRENIVVDDAGPIPRDIDGGQRRLRACRASHASDAGIRSSARGPFELHNDFKRRVAWETRATEGQFILVTRRCKDHTELNHADFATHDAFLRWSLELSL